MHLRKITPGIVSLFRPLSLRDPQSEQQASVGIMIVHHPAQPLPDAITSDRRRARSLLANKHTKSYHDDAMEATTKPRTRLLVIGLLLHLVYIGTVFDRYFKAPSSMG